MKTKNISAGVVKKLPKAKDKQGPFIQVQKRTIATAKKK